MDFNDMIKTTIESYKVAIQPFLKALAHVQKNIVEAGRKISEAFKPITVSKMLGKHQYIQWERMTEEFVNEIYNSQNIDKTLRLMYESDNYRLFYEVAEKCSESKTVGRNSRIIRQAMNSFCNKDYDLAAIGITVVIDGTLSKVTGNTTTNIRARGKQLLKQLDEDEELSSEEYALLALYVSLDEALKTFAASSDFKECEPGYINRHWTVHGRSNRRKTKMDCVKLIRFLYAIILIDELENSNGLETGI